MQHLEVSCAVRPLKWSLGVKWLKNRAKNKFVSRPRLIAEAPNRSQIGQYGQIALGQVFLKELHFPMPVLFPEMVHTQLHLG